MPTENLQRALLVSHHYADVEDMLSQSATMFGLANRKVLSTLKRFYERLRPIIADLNTAAQDDSLQGVHREIVTISNNIRKSWA